MSMKTTCVIGFDEVDWNCQLISKAKEIAGEAQVIAVLLSKPEQMEIERYERCGASVIHVYQSWNITSKGAQILADTIQELYHPMLYMISASEKGKEIAARMSVCLDCGLVAEVIGIENNEELVFTRTTNSASTLARITCIQSAAAMCTVKMNVFDMKEEFSSGKARIEYMEPRQDDETIQQAQLLSEYPLPPKKHVDFKNAKIVIGLGRGAANTECIQYAKVIASYLGAEIGVTRTLVEQGMFGKEHQIGQSGEVVNPEVYLAFGISGAIQHMVGIDKSKLIIAVNRDKKAPIFEYCDYGIVEDCNVALRQIVHLLEEGAHGNKTGFLNSI